MDNDKRIVLKIREAYITILPKTRRMETRHRLMTRLGISVRAFEARIKHKVMIDLEEAVVWAQELNKDVNELYDIVR